jgi:hypothetical protein
MKISIGIDGDPVADRAIHLVKAVDNSDRITGRLG